MYLPYYLLTARPFQISADPRFLWLGDDHQEALANLEYGLSQGNGFVVLVGAVGTGKTTLVNALLEKLDDGVVMANINQPGFDVVEFLSFVARAYDPGAVVASKSECLNFFKNFLQKAWSDGRRVLLVIDEAHRLSLEVLEEIRLLSNLEQDGKKLINIFFVGQTELLHKLRASECRALRQRVTLFYHLRPLTAAETEKYILHRLRVAGCARRLFSDHAMLAIHGYTRGYPRRINKLCDRALLTGYLKDRTQITAAIVRECAREMRRIDPLPGALGRLPALFFSDWRWTWAEEWRQWPWMERCRRGARALGPGLPQALRQMGSTIAAQVPGWAAVPERLAQGARRASLLFAAQKRALVWVFVLVVLTAGLVSGWTLMHAVELNMETAARTNGGATAEPEKPYAMANFPSKAQAPPAVDSAAAHPGPPPSVAEKAGLPPQQSTWIKALTRLNQGNYQEAVALMDAERPSAEQMPVYAQALVGRAGQLMESAPEEARGLLEKAAAADPNNADAPLQLGHLHLRAKQNPKAITYYETAIKLRPTSAEALYNLGFLQAAAGNLSAAEEMFTRVVALKPDYLDKALFNLAVVQQKLGKPRESITALEAAVTLRPENEKAQAYLKRLKAGSREGR
jgi:type II secretory pathway predicted ATPase ExeA/tetratricopeptide (TPR) repeat protein